MDMSGFWTSLKSKVAMVIILAWTLDEMLGSIGIALMCGLIFRKEALTINTEQKQNH
jgi:hypothetical protein